MKQQNRTLDEKDEIDITLFLGILFDYRWVIILTIAIFSLAGYLYALNSSPLYRASALIQIGNKNSGSSLVEDFSKFIPGGGVNDSGKSTEMSLLKSRMVLGGTIEKLNLTAVVKPSDLWMDIQIKLFSTPTPDVNVSVLNVPGRWIGIPMTLTITGENHFQLSVNKTSVLSGKLDELTSMNGVDIKVSNISAQIGQIFSVTKVTEQQALEDLRNAFSVTSSKDDELITLTLVGPNPTTTEHILNTIVADYHQQNISRATEEVSRSLTFLSEQLPHVRKQLDTAEKQLSRFRQSHDSVDLSLEAKSVLEALAFVDSQLSELTFREAEISKLYTKDHPVYRSLLEKRITLQNERDKVNGRVGKMPSKQQDILRLTREVQTEQESYVQLLSKQQELKIKHASMVGNIRIIDSAFAESKPVGPSEYLITFLALILGIISSCGAVLLRYVLHRGIKNAEEVEALGLNVYATIPYAKQSSPMVRKNKKEYLSPLAVRMPTDVTVEAIRTLRTTLHFASINGGSKVIVITGTSPGVGKSFISVNLAIVSAQSGKRVLLIDADMRRGYMHETLGLKNNVGYSDILSGAIDTADVLQQYDINGESMLDVITRGKSPPNPSELLMHCHNQKFLTWASESYDLIILDTPPILAVTDAMLIGRHADNVFLTTKFEMTTAKEIKLCAQRLTANEISLSGVLINGVIKKSSSDIYAYYNYESIR